jgi:hypothetical protein
MNAKWIKLSVAALAATVFSLSAHAVTVPLTGTDANGNTVNSGWVAVYSDAYAAAGWNVNLTFTGLSADGSQFDFEKSATFKSPAGDGIDGLEISFQKVDPNAKELVISDEVLQNQTGTDWSAFQWKLASGGTAAFTFAATGPASSFAISPYTNMSFADSNSTINFNGGSVAQGATWSPGANSSTGIAIVSGSEDSFVLKEIPVAIPLPAAAWTGLSSLLGLALLSTAKKRLA